MQLSRDVPSQEPHARKRKARMSTRKALESIVQQVLVRLRTDGIVGQAVHGRIGRPRWGLTDGDGMRSRTTDTHLDHLCDDAGDRKRRRHAQHGVMSVPFAPVYPQADEEDKYHRDPKGDEEQQLVPDRLWLNERVLDGNVKQGEVPLVSADPFEKGEEDP